jgi:hypothetical protein
MNAMTYTINPLHGFMGQRTVPAAYVCDADDRDIERRRMEIDAQIRSGDYFIMLATKLDELSQLEQIAHDDAISEMQRLVGDLLYLQHRYEIKRK